MDKRQTAQLSWLLYLDVLHIDLTAYLIHMVPSHFTHSGPGTTRLH